MSIEYIRDYYHVPAKKGKIVSYKGKLGTIIGANGPHVKIRLEGKRNAFLYHPLDPDLKYDVKG